MSRSLFALALICLLSSPVSAQEPSDWKTFTSKAGRFSVSVPGTPIEDAATKKGDAAASGAHTLTLTVKDSAYILSYTDYPPDKVAKANAAKILSAAVDGGIANAKGKLISELEITVNGFPGRDVRASVPIDGKPGTARFRIVLANSRQYMALFVGTEESASLPGVDGFLNSFQVLAPEPQTGWQTLKSGAGGFSVQFPGTPKEDSADIAAGGKIYRYTVDKGGYAYIVSYNTISDGQPTPSVVQLLLNKGRDGIVTSLKGELVDEKPISIAGNAGKALKIAMPDKSGTAYLHAYVVGERYYQLLLLGANKDLTSVKPNVFFDSFRLTEPAKPAPWGRFAAKESGFSVELPGTAKTEKLSDDTTKFTVESGKTSYVVVAVELKSAPDAEKTSVILDAVRDEEVKALDAMIISREPVKIGDTAGIQVHLSVPATKMPGGGYAIERFFLVGRRVFEFAVVSITKFEDSEFARFFDSVKFTTPKECN